MKATRCQHPNRIKNAVSSLKTPICRSLSLQSQEFYLGRFIKSQSVIRSIMSSTVLKMPFISGHVNTECSSDPSGSHEPQGDIEATVPLAKVQQVLWTNHLKEPFGTHYNLTLSIDFDIPGPSVEQLIQGQSVSDPG